MLAIRGNKNCAVFGELFGTAVLGRKGAGVVTNGYARDLKELYEMDFPLFYGGKNPLTSKGRREINESQLPVLIEGVTPWLSSGRRAPLPHRPLRRAGLKPPI